MLISIRTSIKYNCFKWNSVYIALCDGDSGGPVWLTDDNVIVAVNGGVRKVKDGKDFEPICTSNSNFATKITKNLLAWIQENMEK